MLSVKQEPDQRTLICIFGKGLIQVQLKEGRHMKIRRGSPSLDQTLCHHRVTIAVQGFLFIPAMKLANFFLGQSRLLAWFPLCRVA